MFSNGFYEEEYRRKLVSSEDAVAGVVNDELITFAGGLNEPQALLWALTSRLRGGELERLRVFSGPPGPHAADSLLAMDLLDQVFPAGMCAHLRGRRDLGIHTELLGPELIDLVRCGAVTGARKTLHAGSGRRTPSRSAATSSAARGGSSTSCAVPSTRKVESRSSPFPRRRRAAACHASCRGYPKAAW